MKLLDILSVDCIKAPLESTRKQDVINELVDVLAGAGRIIDAESLRKAVWEREQTRTTGIGHGLAIPHGKCLGMSELAMALGKPPEPIDFEAIDNQPVSLVVLLASPPDKRSEHIQALARISRLMTMEDFRDQIYSASTPEEIFELLKGQESLV